MKTSTLLLLATSFASITACTGQDYSEQNYGDSKNVQTTDHQSSNMSTKINPTYEAQKPKENDQKDEAIVMHTIINSKTGRPFAQIPLPASWQLTRSKKAGVPAISGPHGLKIYASAYSSFVYAADPMTRQVYEAYGQEMRQPIGIGNVIRQDLMAMANQRGLRFDRQYPLPRVAQKDKSYMDQLYTLGSRNNNFQATATEWIDKNGKNVLIVIHYNEVFMTGMVTWGYYTQSVSAETNYFEKAKNAYITGLFNMQYNTESIAAHNQKEASRANRSWSNHNQRMRQNQAAFDARQRTFRETSEAINKASMDAYRNRNASGDRIQHGFNNYIKDETTVTDPATGKNYQVEGYADQYWMNGNGEYIKSDNSLYNPNLDPNYNSQTWQKAPKNPHGR